MLVMDNATIHHAKYVKNLLDILPIFYLAPYSPFMNAIEEVFGITKFHYRKQILQNSLNLDKNILTAFKQL